MRSHRLLLLTALLLAPAFVGVLSTTAKESFTDEAGRILYTIDDDGIVSMFENSPTDLTISVTRGTREKMQPRITEVSPATIPAGTTIVLKLRGENLVGASVKMSLPGIEVQFYAAKPRQVDIPIHVPANTPPGAVTIEVTTPIGRTTTGFTVTDFQIGGGAPSQREGGVKKAVSTSAPASCPAGMVGVAAERGGFCIEVEQSFTSDYQKSVQTCALAGNRRCDAAEWRTACEEAGAGRLSLKNMLGDWEWTGTEVIREVPGQPADYGAAGDLTVILLGRSDCKTERYFQTWGNESHAGRCCK